MISCDVLVLGAGSVGMPLAAELARRKVKVIVVDKESSHGRGQNRAAIGGIRATHSDPAKIEICRRSLDIFERMQNDGVFDIEWKRGGYLFVAYDDEREKSLKALLSRQQSFGLPIKWIGPDEVQELAPGIRKEGLRGGSYGYEDGHAMPLKVSAAFKSIASAHGAKFHFDETVREIDVESGRITEVRTDKESYAADWVVNAAGADAADIASFAGMDIPVMPDLHEAGVTDAVEHFIDPMIVDIRPDGNSGNYYFYQSETGQVVFCITPRPQAFGNDNGSTSGFLPMVVRRMLELCPRLRNLRVRRTWRGMYPMTPDGNPIVGAPKEATNFMLATGMCGQGFMLGPGLAEALADEMTGSRGKHETVFRDLSPYRKFEGAELLK